MKRPDNIERNKEKRLDLKGKTFNFLTGIKFDKIEGKTSYWLFKCKCGNIKSIRASSVKTGLTKSCGCLTSRRKDLVGKTFYNFTFLEDTGKTKLLGKGKAKRAIWKVRCSCGTIKEVVARHVISGNTKSCGCIRKQTENSSFKTFYKSYERGATQRDIQFKINFDFFKKMCKLNCYYCGKKPRNKKNDQTFKVDFFANGIDRKDNTKGYIKGNCVPCCTTCNKMKMVLDPNEFLYQCQKITYFNEDKQEMMGPVMHDVEYVVSKMIETHDLQKGEVMSLISSYIDVHYPGAIEEYEDGSHPVYLYAHRDFIKKIGRGMK